MVWQLTLLRAVVLVALLVTAWQQTGAEETSGTRPSRIPWHLDNVLTVPRSGVRVGLFEASPADSIQIGFLMPDQRFFRVKERADGLEDHPYAFSGVNGWAVHGQYVVLDMAMGSTGYNTFIFLFKVRRDGVDLLQVIDEDDLSQRSFISMYYPRPPPTAPGPMPKWFSPTDIDGDRFPDLAFYLFSPSQRDHVVFFEVVNDRIRLNLSASIYARLFQKEVSKGGNCRTSDEYWVYGLLSGRIRAEHLLPRPECDREMGEAAVGWIANLRLAAQRLETGDLGTHGFSIVESTR
jgi:hypothetical protein